MKTYICSSVLLTRLPWKHRANNGNCQKSVLIRAKTKKRVAELLGTTVKSLNNWGCSVNEAFAKFVPKDETIYYKPEMCGEGFIKDWVELVPDTCKHDFDSLTGKWNPNTAVCRHCGVKYQ